MLFIKRERERERSVFWDCFPSCSARPRDWSKARIHCGSGLTLMQGFAGGFQLAVSLAGGEVTRGVESQRDVFAPEGSPSNSNP